MITELEILSLNLAHVEARIEAACKRSGRNRSEINLIWVSKNNPQAKLLLAAKLGAKIFGENRVQEVLEKFPLPLTDSSTPALHFIGRLQKNKIRKILASVSAIHSIDSVDLLLSVNRIAEELKVTPEVFLQINTSREIAKGGFEPESIAEEFSKIPLLSHLRIVGLMTMGPVAAENLDELSLARNCFRELKQILLHYQGSLLPPPSPEGDRHASVNALVPSPFQDLRWLSMGMTGDFEVAIEEGAHFIRVGTGLFGMQNLPQGSG